MSRIKNEEMVPMADDVWDSFKRDQVELEAENTTLTTAYLDAFKVMTDEVRNIEQSDSMSTTQKTVTGKLYLAGDAMKKDLKLFQKVIEKSRLDTKIVSVLLKNITRRNMEGALVNIKSVSQIVADNTALLTTKGMKVAFPAFLSENFDTITTLSNEQNKIMKNRKELTDDNHGSYKALYEFITDVCGIGATTYEGEVKADEYTISKLLTKLHSSGGKGGGGTTPPTA
ncbi:MAG: hypothetical protein H7239_00915 [Flavobacterium sp.]|nr:hypothetical protein [Flavobacterium sp.]